MSGRAIRGTIPLETDSIGPTIGRDNTCRSQDRAEYFPVLPSCSCNNLFIIMTFHNEISKGMPQHV